MSGIAGMVFANSVPPAVSGGATDPYFSSVKFLLQGGYADGTTTMTNLGNGSLTLSRPTGSAEWKTTQTKFTSSSLYLDGSSNVNIANAADIQATTGDWTWEFWAYQTGRPARYGVMIGGSGNSPTYVVRWTMSDNAQSYATPYFYVEAWQNSSVFMGGNYQDAADSFTQNAWHHFVFQRYQDDFSTYIDGVRTGYYNNSLTLETVSDVRIGSTYGNTQFFQGYMDGIRFTKGVARYSGSTLTVPTAAFPTS
jgi:hypothetical protein